jgi:hypothetical protein
MVEHGRPVWRCKLVTGLWRCLHELLLPEVNEIEACDGECPAAAGMWPIAKAGTKILA